jgi:hypothetical protein
LLHSFSECTPECEKWWWLTSISFVKKDDQTVLMDTEEALKKENCSYLMPES